MSSATCPASCWVSSLPAPRLLLSAWWLSPLRRMAHHVDSHLAKDPDRARHVRPSGSPKSDKSTGVPSARLPSGVRRVQPAERDDDAVADLPGRAARAARARNNLGAAPLLQRRRRRRWRLAERRRRVVAQGGRRHHKSVAARGQRQRVRRGARQHDHGRAARRGARADARQRRRRHPQVQPDVRGRVRPRGGGRRRDARELRPRPRRLPLQAARHGDARRRTAGARRARRRHGAAAPRRRPRQDAAAEGVRARRSCAG